MEIIKRIVCFFCLLNVCGCTVASTPLNIEKVNPDVVDRLNTVKPTGKSSGKFSDENHVVAHAMGAVDGFKLTNSLEAFIENYEKGTRVFEIDLECDSQGNIVLTHGWPWFNDELIGNNLEYTALDSNTFVQSKIYGKYQPLTFNDVLYILQRYQDVYFVIDSKTFDYNGFVERYTQISNEVQHIDPQLLKRIIPQAYDFDMALWLKNESLFEDYILTCYSIYDESNGLEIYEFVRDNQVPIVTMHMDNDWAEKVITDIYAYATYQETVNDFKIYIHTVNDLAVAEKIKNEYGFHGIYSDDINEVQWKELK